MGTHDEFPRERTVYLPTLMVDFHGKMMYNVGKYAIVPWILWILRDKEGNMIFLDIREFLNGGLIVGSILVGDRWQWGLICSFFSVLGGSFKKGFSRRTITYKFVEVCLLECPGWECLVQLHAETFFCASVLNCWADPIWLPRGLNLLTQTQGSLKGCFAELGWECLPNQIPKFTV